MSVFKIRNRLAVAGSLTLGGDVVLSRGAASRLDLASGDTLRLISGTLQLSSACSLVGAGGTISTANQLDLSGGTTLLPNGTAAIGTAGLTNGRIRIGTQGGTYAIAFDANGTTWFVLKDGNL